MRSLGSSRSRFSHKTAAIALLLLAACSGAETEAPSTSTRPAPTAIAPRVTSRDETGAPKFLWAARTPNAPAIAGAPKDVARAHLLAHAGVLGFSRNLASTALLVNHQVLEGGASVTSFGQKLGGITVFRTRASVIMDRNNNLVAISGNLRGAAEQPAKVGQFVIPPEDALVKAYADRFGSLLPTSAVHDLGAEPNGEYHDYNVATPAGAPRILAGTARVRKVYVPQNGRLVAGYHVELVARAAGKTQNDAWLYAIAADDGRTLIKNALTHFDKFTYRVWAEQGSASQNNIPLDGPLTDSTPLPASATPETVKEGPYVATSLVTVEGFNKNPNGVADPWLASGAAQSQGNNVDAYTDRNSQENGVGDGFDEGIDIRATTTAANTFDRTYDVTMDPGVSQDQERAAVTQLFYNTNWLHDYWYDSGFDEQSGNAQQSNYGRGGIEGDPLHAEAQDGADVGLSDNANMSVLSDGSSPRMQMYVWHGGSVHSLTATGGAAFPDGIDDMDFGASSFDVTGDFALSSPADACSAVSGVSGKVAVIDRGTCTFAAKVKAAQDAGAVAVLIVNNDPTGGPIEAAGTDTTITIGGFGISQADGIALKTKIAGGTITGTLKRAEATMRDGDIDNSVVAHEWGHYLHHRLVDCGSESCDGMSEGWADFDALMMVIKAGDDLNGTSVALAQYASVANNPSSQFFGIRRAPYSTDFGKDPFTFIDIRKDTVLPTNVELNIGDPDNTEVHNVGEIWAVMLYEGYANLLADTKTTPPRFTFEQAKRRMADYIVAGMKATPVEPTFVEQRDAILATVFAKDPQDFTELAKGFAKRGLGVGAVAPPTSSTDLDEAVEDYSFKGNLSYIDAVINDAIRSCDRDGFLDADEAGDVLIRVQNSGWVNLQNTTATVASTAAGVTFPKGTSATIVSIDPYGIVKVRVTIALDKSVATQEFVPITITLANGDAFNASVTGNIEPRANFDEAKASSLVDDVEAPDSPWTQIHAIAGSAPAWARAAKTDANGKPLDPPDFEWLGTDLAVGLSDESLVSPSMTVSTTDSFTLSFKHKYAFEFAPAANNTAAMYFDGGVIEISSDGGATWQDISTYADPGYPHTIFKNSSTGGDTSGDNPLSDRPGFTGEQADYTTLSLDLGTQLAGKTVQVRFRIGADPAGGAMGWEIDDITVAGVTNKPFTAVVDDTSVCMNVPIAVAGPAQTVQPGANVVLDASGSSSPANLPLTYQWEQLDGPDVTLNDPTAAISTGFIAPQVTTTTVLTFRVTVADPHQAAADSVTITVAPPSDGGGDADLGSPGTPANDNDGGCSCHTTSGDGAGNAAALGGAVVSALAFLMRGRRKRRA